MRTDDSCNHCGSLRSLLSAPPVSDRTCRHCGTVWSVQGEPFTLCRGCREKLPVRKVNTTPLDRRFRPMPAHADYLRALIDSGHSIYYAVDLPAFIRKYLTMPK